MIGNFHGPAVSSPGHKEILEFEDNKVALYRIRQGDQGQERVKVKELALSSLFKELKKTLRSRILIQTPILAEGTRCYVYNKGNGPRYIGD